MSPPGFQRARKPEEKEERRAVLLQTAERLLREYGDCSSLSLNELARQAGMAKSNVYRYFESREALMLAILEQEWAGWFEDFRVLSPKKGESRWELEPFTGCLAKSLDGRPLLSSLMSCLPSVLEHNVSVETARDFKLNTLLYIHEVALSFHEVCPTLTASEHEELIHHMVVALTSLWPYSNPSPSLREALKDPRLEVFRHDFVNDLERSILLTARGLQVSSKQK